MSAVPPLCAIGRGLCCRRGRRYGAVSAAGHPEPAEAEDVANEGSAEHRCDVAAGSLLLPAPRHLPEAVPVSLQVRYFPPELVQHPLQRWGCQGQSGTGAFAWG